MPARMASVRSVGRARAKRVIGVRPGVTSTGHQTPALGEINVNVAKVGLQPLAGIVGQGNEGFAAVAAMAADVAANLIVAAAVAVLVTQAAEDLHGGVTLLGRGILVGGENGVDDRVKGAQNRGGRRFGARVGLGLQAGRGPARTFRREW